MVEQRKRKVTDPFQWRIFFRLLGYGLIYQVTVWNLMFCWRLLHHDGDLLAQYREFCYESYPMLLGVLILIPALAWDAVKYCHRIAGPIYRFRSVLRDIAVGKPVRRVQLRQGDELISMQNDFNAMLDGLAARGSIELVTGNSTRADASDLSETPSNQLAEPELVS